jgi:hypothetical protein
MERNKNGVRQSPAAVRPTLRLKLVGHGVVHFDHHFPRTTAYLAAAPLVHARTVSPVRGVSHEQVTAPPAHGGKSWYIAMTTAPRSRSRSAARSGRNRCRGARHAFARATELCDLLRQSHLRTVVATATGGRCQVFSLPGRSLLETGGRRADRVRGVT